MYKIPGLAIALLIGLATSPTKADTILTYTWSPNAGFTNGTRTEHLSGGFTWDASTDTLSSVNTIFSGDINFTAWQPAAIELSPTTSAIFVRAGTTYPFAVLAFAGLLEDGGTHDLITTDTIANTTQVQGTGSLDQILGLSVQGYASTGVPEPTTMAVISVGLVGLGLARRRRTTRRSA